MALATCSSAMALRELMVSKDVIAGGAFATISTGMLAHNIWQPYRLKWVEDQYESLAAEVVPGYSIEDMKYEQQRDSIHTVIEAIEEAPFSIRFFSPFFGFFPEDGRVTAVKPPPPPPKRRKKKLKKKQTSQGASSTNNRFLDEFDDLDLTKNIHDNDDDDDDDNDDDDFVDERFLPHPSVEIEHRSLSLRQSDIYFNVYEDEEDLTFPNSHSALSTDFYQRQHHIIGTVKTVSLDIWSPPKDIPRLGFLVFLLPSPNWIPTQYLKSKLSNPRKHAAVTSMYSLASQGWVVCGVQLEGESWQADMDIARAAWKWAANDKRRHSLMTYTKTNTSTATSGTASTATTEHAYSTSSLVLGGSSTGGHIAMLLSLELNYNNMKEQEKKLKENLNEDMDNESDKKSSSSKNKKLKILHSKDSKTTKPLPIPSSLVLFYPKSNWGKEIDHLFIENLKNMKKNQNQNEKKTEDEVEVEEEVEVMISEPNVIIETIKRFWNYLFEYKPSLSDSSIVLFNYLNQLNQIKKVQKYHQTMHNTHNDYNDEDDETNDCHELSLAYLPPTLILHGSYDSHAPFHDVSAFQRAYNLDVDAFKNESVTTCLARARTICPQSSTGNEERTNGEEEIVTQCSKTSLHVIKLSAARHGFEIARDAAVFASLSGLAQWLKYTVHPPPPSAFKHENKKTMPSSQSKDGKGDDDDENVVIHGLSGTQSEGISLNNDGEPNSEDLRFF